MTPKYYPLSQPQRRIWSTQMIYPNSSMFNIGGIVTIHGPIDPGLLSKAILNFIYTHDSFQIRLMVLKGAPQQYFSEQLPKNIEMLDYSGQVDKKDFLEQWVDEKASEPFDLEKGPLYEFAILKFSDYQYGYFVKLHHVIADGWSVQLLTDGILQNYMDLKNGQSETDNLHYPYQWFLQSEQEYLQSSRYKKNKQFWNELFSPLGEQAASIRDDNLSGKRKRFWISTENMRQIKKFCELNKITVNAFFVSLYLLYINKTTDQDDLVIGLPVLGRSGREERKTFGMFVSSLPFRFVVNHEETLAEMMQSVNAGLKRCYANQKYPYNHLVKDLKKEDMALYTSCVNYYNTDLCNSFDGYPIDNNEFYNGQQEYDLQIIIRDWLVNKELQIDFDYKTQIFTDIQINDIYNRLDMLMNLAFQSPQEKIRYIALLTMPERKNNIVTFNKTEFAYPKDKTVVDLFVDQVRATPDRMAVKKEGKSLTYTQLNESSDRLAAYLQSQGVTNNTIVGLLTSHSIETVVGILGILKSGAAYLPIDPLIPSGRMSYILKDSNIGLLLTNICMDKDVQYNGKILHLDDVATWSAHDLKWSKLQKNSECAAYCIYTSGSTGQPKGAIIDHINLTNYIYWAREVYVTHDIEVFPLYSSLSFDLTVTSIFTPLISGGQIIIYEDDEEDKHMIHRIINDNFCSIVKLTPSHLQLFTEISLKDSQIKKLIVGGEELKSDLAKHIHDRFSGRISIFNEYGPTEATVGCMIYQYDPELNVTGAVPIGRPGGNNQIYLLDKNLNPVLSGTRGEMYISGDGLARGYLNQPELTHMRFVPNPFTSQGRMYKTGDVATFIYDKTLLYLGRGDEQVKIRGHRIELTEIENCMKQYPGIDAAVVTDYQITDSTCQLCGYFSSHSNVDIEQEQLRLFLRNLLPEYMMPSFLIQLNPIPLTLNGKINKSALPLPDLKKEQVREEVPLSSEEEQFLSVFALVLEVPAIQMDDNFYYLGGDSIKAIQISSHLSESGLKLKTKDILANPIFKDMLNYAVKSNTLGVPQDLCAGNIPVTPIIDWFHSREMDNRGAYCQGVCLQLNQFMDTNILANIMTHLLRHHDGLRMNYNDELEMMFYNNEHLSKMVPILEWELSSEEMDEIDEQLEIKMLESMQNIDICKDLLLRTSLCRTPAGDMLCIIIHHLAVDGMSWRILLEDIEALIEQSQQGIPFQLPRKTHSYLQWAKSLQYQSQAGDGLQSTCTISLDKKYNKIVGNINRDVTALILHQANIPYQTKPVELLFSALQLSVHEIIKHNVQVEIESHGRNNCPEELDISRTVGWFTQILTVANHAPFDNLSSSIKMQKEIYRDAFKANMESASCERVQDNFCMHFNYLGEFKLDYATFSLLPMFYVSDELTCDAEMDLLLINGQIKVMFRTRRRTLSMEETNHLFMLFLQKLEMIVAHCSSKKDIEFTPSDFDATEITQDEIDLLFQ